MSAKTLEIEEKSIDAAIENACREFGVPREKLNIEIISRHSGGFWGLLSKKAKISAIPAFLWIHGFVGKRPLLYYSHNHGCDAVYSTEDDARYGRSYAGKDYVVDALNSHFFLFKLSCRAGHLLVV